MNEEKKELTPLDKARAEFARKNPNGYAFFERSQEQQKTQSAPKVEKTPPPVVEQTTKNDNEKKSAPADPEPDEKKDGEEKKEKTRKRRRTREEIMADLEQRRDTLNKKLAALRLVDSKKERKTRNHRLIQFAAHFEKFIYAVCTEETAKANDEKIDNLAEQYIKQLKLREEKREG